jgi:hypothetical protein
VEVPGAERAPDVRLDADVAAGGVGDVVATHARFGLVISSGSVCSMVSELHPA